MEVFNHSDVEVSKICPNTKISVITKRKSKEGLRIHNLDMKHLEWDAPLENHEGVGMGSSARATIDGKYP
jgi:hypothetical protein